MSALPGAGAPDVFLIACANTTAAAAPQPDPACSAESMGGKAWNLQRMAALGLPVPPAFVLGTRYGATLAARQAFPGAQLWQAPLAALEAATGRRLGDARRPLLVSVRSGAAISMPGMMETLLNIGLCDATVGGFLRQTGDPHLVWDAYRRLIASYGEVVHGLPAALFADATAALFPSRDERELDFAELRTLTARLLDVFAQAAGRAFPQQPAEQLAAAIEAVFASWRSPKAAAYRQLKSIPEGIGTAVTVQTMVFGNASGESGAGVGFTRDPITGEAQLWVDFLFNAQGEDVVSGRRSAEGHEALTRVLPEVWLALSDAASRIERAFGDMQDFEFTVENSQLFLLQCRNGKRSARATARIALDLLDAGWISRSQALERTAGLDRDSLALPHVVAENAVAGESAPVPQLLPLAPLGQAVSANSGVATGALALDQAHAEASHARGESVILVRRDAETSDIAALDLSVGLLTQRGARTSHAAVVARQLGKVCLVGCDALRIDEAARTITLGDTTLPEGALLTLDGNQGLFYAGATRTVLDFPEDLLARLALLRQGEAALITGA